MGSIILFKMADTKSSIFSRAALFFLFLLLFFFSVLVPIFSMGNLIPRRGV